MRPNQINLKSFKVKPKLCPKIWHNFKIDPKVRNRLLKIAKDFYNTLKIDVKLIDALYMGSTASYNWSKYSDIDLHLLIDYSKFDADEDLMKNYFTAKKNEWNNKHEDLTLYGFPVEVYIQDVNEENASNGVFSLRYNRWNKIPNSDDIEMNDEAIKELSSSWINSIDQLENVFENHCVTIDDYIKLKTKVSYLWNVITKGRKVGLKREGEGSLENIAFKVLRRTEDLGRLKDLKTKIYDKINSLEN